MKKLLSILLAAILLMTCLSAMAEERPSETALLKEFGLTLELSSLRNACANDFALDSYGVRSRDPYSALGLVDYCLLPVDTVNRIFDDYEALPAEAQETWLPYLRRLTPTIAFFITTDAPDMETAFDAAQYLLEEGEQAEEVATQDGWHCYYITMPMDSLLSIFDDPGFVNDFAPRFIAEDYSAERAAAEKEIVRGDIEKIHSGMMARIQSAELSTPTDPMAALVGQTLAFETTDLDGSPVSSADLFGDNRITMVNLWGTWCSNCLDEMADLAQLHTRLQQVGCGVVGLEYEQKPIEEVADTARAIMAENGVAYPNALQPAEHPILDQFSGYPTTLFVDSTGRILTYPIIGAYVEQYESTIEALLEGEDVDAASEAENDGAAANDSAAVNDGATANGEGKYRVYVCDTDGNPVEGAFIQFCDDATCAFQPTDANGLAEFSVDAEKVYEVHVLKVPEGFRQDERSYETLDSYSDVSIFLEKAE